MNINSSKFNIDKLRVGLLVAILVFLPFEMFPKFSVYGINIRISQLLGLILIISCYPLLIRKVADIKKQPWLWLAGFVVVSAISSIFALSQQKAISTTLFYAFDILLAYCVYLVFSTQKSDLYKKIIFAVSVFVAVFCMYQFVGDTLGLNSGLLLLETRYTKLIFGFPRIQGFSIEPLYLANYLLIPIGLSLGALIVKPQRYLYGLLTLFTYLVWLTVARGAYFAVLSMLILSLVIIVYKKQYRLAVNIVLLISFSAFLAFASIWASGKFATQLPESTKSQTQYQTSIPQEGISSEGNTERLVEHTVDFTDETSFTDRIKTSKTAGQLFVQNPLTGVGPGNFGRYVVQKYPGTYTDVDQIVNNEPLEILAEVGLLGFLMLVGFAVWCIGRIANYSVSRNNANSNIWYYSTMFMMLGFLVQWQTFSTLYVTHIWVMIGIMLSILLNSRLRKSN